MAVAIDAFHTKIASVVVDGKDLVFKLQTEFQGEIIWASLCPDQWAFVVNAGDSLGVEAEGTDALSRYQQRTAMFNLLGEFGKGITSTFVPRAYEVSYACEEQEILFFEAN